MLESRREYLVNAQKTSCVQRAHEAGRAGELGRSEMMALNTKKRDLNC